MGNSKRVDDDPRSSEPSVAEVIRLVDAAGQREWINRRSAQREAADLLAQVLDEGVVDQVLALPEGTTRGWLDNDTAFREHVVARRRNLEIFADPGIDYTRALTPKQIRAAALLIEEEMTQVRAAETVGVDPRTIYNWLRQPVFQLYSQQLSDERAQRLSLAADAEVAVRRAEDRALRQKAVRLLGDLIDAGDGKAAERVFKPLIDH